MRSAVGRSVALLAVLVVAGTACVSPHGAPVGPCGPEWDPVIVDGPHRPTELARSVAVECYRVVAERRIEVGFLMPPGPDCYALEAVEVIESDEAISLEVRIGRETAPLGSCPDERLPWGATVELNGPAEGRQVLDASVPPDS